MIELRWVLSPKGGNASHPRRLQCRLNPPLADRGETFKWEWAEWRDVPHVMEHDFYKPSDFTGYEAETSQLARAIVDGGLAVCKVCKKAEGELDAYPMCPGEPAGEDPSTGG